MCGDINNFFIENPVLIRLALYEYSYILTALWNAEEYQKMRVIYACSFTINMATIALCTKTRDAIQNYTYRLSFLQPILHQPSYKSHGINKRA